LTELTVTVIVKGAYDFGLSCCPFRLLIAFINTLLT